MFTFFMKYKWKYIKCRWRLETIDDPEWAFQRHVVLDMAVGELGVWNATLP
jgi:hypothetical protein